MSYPEVGDNFGTYGPEERFVNEGTATNYTNGGYNGGMAPGAARAAGGGGGSDGGAASNLRIMGTLRAGRFAAKGVERAYQAEQDSGFTDASRAEWTANGSTAEQNAKLAQEEKDKDYSVWNRGKTQDAINAANASIGDDHAMGKSAHETIDRDQASRAMGEELDQKIARAGLTGSSAQQENSSQEYQKSIEEAQALQDSHGGKADYEKATAEANAIRAKAAALQQKQQAEIDDKEQDQQNQLFAQQDIASDKGGDNRDKAAQDELKEKHREEAARLKKEFGQEMADQYTKDVAPKEDANLAKDQAAKRVEDEQKAQDEITSIQAKAGESRMRASGDILGAEKAAKFAALDEETAKAQHAADAETDAVKKASLQKIADVQSAAAASEKADIEKEQQQEKAKATAEAAASTAESALRFSGRGDEADDIAAQQKADEERRAGKVDPSVIDATLKEKQDEIAYRKANEQHRADVEEMQSSARAAGQGKLADYEGLEEKEAERIRAAEMTGDKRKIEQAQRIAGNDIKAWQRENQQKGHLYNSTEEFSNHLMFLGSDDGLSAAMRKSKDDQHQLARHGNIGAGTHDGRSHLDDSARNLSLTADKLKKLFATDRKLVTIDR